MEKITSLIILAIIGLFCCSLQAQDIAENKENKTRYIGVQREGILPKPDVWHEGAIPGIARINQEVTLLDSTEGSYVKIRTTYKGKTIEGWVRKSALNEEKTKVNSSVASSIGHPSAGMGSKGNIGYDAPDVSSLKRDSVDPPWDQIDLTGYRMKPGVVFDAKVRKKIPWWAYALPPVAAGVTVLILNDEESSGQELIVTDDQFTVPCNSTQTLDVLVNDQGEDLIIMTAEGPAGLTFTDMNLEISGLISDATLTYIVRDASGNTAMGSVQLTVSFPPIAAADDAYETDFETVLNGDVSANDVGDDLQITVLTEPVSGMLSLFPDGQFTYQPDDGFSGQDQFQYRITDRCGQEETATVIITVGEAPCDFNVSVETNPTHCGLSDGSASIGVDPDGTYMYAWSDGSAEKDRNDLEEGLYSVTISDEQECEKIIEVEIGSLPADYDLAVTASSGTCIGGGEITISLSSPGPGPMVFRVDGPGGTMEFNAPPGSGIQLSDQMEILAGEYSIVVWDQSAGEECSEMVSISVPDESPDPMAMDDHYTVSVAVSVSGNVLDNDEGLFLRVIEHTDPSSGTLVLNADGTFEYQSVQDPPDEVSFLYTIRDTCGQEAQAEVIIEIMRCEFEASIETTDAHCGLSDGSAVIDIDPSGNYQINWSDGTSGVELMEVAAGTYQVTVIDLDSDCALEYTTEINDLPAEYGLDLSTEPASCIGNGEIIISFDNPGEGPLVVRVEGPGDTTEFTAPNGEDIALSDQMNILPGNYTITVWDETAGEGCSQAGSVSVSEESPAPNAMDDEYSTGPAQVLSGNVLDNDEGLFIQIEDYTEPARGLLVIQSDGSFQYIPDGNGGDPVTFEYYIVDTCGARDTASVSIEFIECTFEASFGTTPANCGIEDGLAVINLDPPGNYEITWSNGTMGAVLENVLAGDYSVTVVDVDLGCSLEFQTTIEELPAEYIEEVVPIQPFCDESGDIILDLITPGSGPLLIEVTHPNGMETFSQGGEGIFTLSEHLDVVPGNYSFVIRDAGLPNHCTDETSVILNAYPVPQILLEGVIPPSSESSNDGQIIILIEVGANPPYTVFVNGMNIGQVSGSPFTIQNVPAGFYQIFIVDANGCQSNTLQVELFPGSGLTGIESGWILINPPAVSGPSLVEHPPPDPQIIGIPVLSFTFNGVQNIIAPWARIRYGNTGMVSHIQSSQFQFLNVQGGIQRTFSIKTIRVRPRLGISYTNWFMDRSPSGNDIGIWHPIGEAELEIPFFDKRFRLYARNTVEGLRQPEWSFEAGLKAMIR